MKKKTLLSVAQALATAVLAVALAGCVDHIRVLHDAEDIFNRAAQAENRARMDLSAQPEFVATTGLVDLQGYRIAAQSIKNLIDKKEDDLKKDNLLCTARMVQAMSLWRLGEFTNASETARKSCDGAKEGDAPRDRALLRAIPYLIRIDESNANLFKKEIGFGKIKSEIEIAVKGLSEVSDSVPRGHPLHGYLGSAALAAARVWHVAPGFKGLAKDKAADERGAALKIAQDLLNNYGHVITCELGIEEQKAAKILQYWSFLFGNLKTPTEKCPVQPH